MASVLILSEREREATAERLLRSSQKLSFDPDVDVDWETPFEPGKWFHVPERSSLYGTYLWDRLSEDQRIELTKHEFASVTETGIWFEIILMQMLMRHAYDRDPRTNHVQYALVETADECRHSRMFARYLEVAGTPRYGPGHLTHRLGRLMNTRVTNDAMVFGGTLYVEAILDAFQRDMMQDVRVQPMVQQIARIHVVEEARHMRYADEEMARVVEGQSSAQRAWTNLGLLLIAERATDAMIHPRVYRSVGLDVDEALTVRSTNPHWQRTLRWAATKPLRAYASAGLLDGRVTRRAWETLGLLSTG